MTQDPNNPGNPEEEEFIEEDFGDFADFPDPADHPDFAMPADEAGDIPTDDLDETFSDEWEEGGEEAGGEPESAKKSGLKGLSFNTIVIGIAVIVGLGVLAYQVMGTKSSPGGAGRFQSALNFTGSSDGPVLGQTEAEQPTVENQQEPAQSDTGFLNNPDGLNGSQSATNEQSPPMPSPISNETDDQGMQQAQTDSPLTPMPATQSALDVEFDEAQPIPRGPDDQPAASAAEETAQASPALDVIRNAQEQQQETAPQQEQAGDSQTAQLVAEEKSEPASTDSAPPATQSLTETASSAQTSVSGEQLTLLMKKLDDVSSRLDGMEKQIADISQAGKSQYAALEKEIDALKEAPTPKATAVETKPQKTAPAEKTASEAVPMKEKPAPKKQAAKKEVSSPKATSTARWELRSAKPGYAWVSRQGEQDIQSVQVGDSLAGIGQITRIEYVGGRWIVSATQGEIRQ